MAESVNPLEFYHVLLILTHGIIDNMPETSKLSEILSNIP
jgi:hypothetical protein